MKDTVRETIARLDQSSGNYGFSQGYGMADYQAQGARMLPMGPTNYSVNPAIANATRGTSTFKVSVSCAVTGTGSGNDYNPIFLFGGEAFSNASRGYTSVRNAGQVTALAYTNNKNVVTFKYSTDEANYSTYTVTLTTDGEYPFILNSLTGVNKMTIKGIQTQITDADMTEQLGLGIQTFFLDEFGKATTNDLTTPPDLYQQATNGVYIPHQFEISGKQGIVTDVLESNDFAVSYFFYALK